jgi:hypothetical protein
LSPYKATSFGGEVSQEFKQLIQQPDVSSYELATLILSEMEQSEQTTHWGKAYEWLLEAGPVALDRGADFFSEVLSYLGERLLKHYSNVPVGAWIAHAIERRGFKFSRESWLFSHAQRFMPDSWSGVLLSQQNMKTESYAWRLFSPSAGLDILDPKWNKGDLQDFISIEDESELLAKAAKRVKLLPKYRAAAAALAGVARGYPKTMPRQKWSPEAAWLEKYVGEIPASFTAVFSLPQSLEETLPTEVDAWLLNATADQLRTLYYLAISEFAYPFWIETAFRKHHPKEDLVEKDLWGQRPLLV